MISVRLNAMCKYAHSWSGVYDPGNVFRATNGVLTFNTNDEFYGKAGAAYSVSSNLSLRANAVLGTSGRLRVAARLNF